MTAPIIRPVIAQVNTISDYWDLFLEGFWVTVQLTALSFTFAMVIGIVVASLRVSPDPAAAARSAWSTSRRCGTSRCC